MFRIISLALMLVLLPALSSIDAYAEEAKSKAEAKPKKALPVEYFGNLPDASRLTLSPDGKKMAAIIRFDVDDTKGSAVQVVDFDTGEKKMVLFTDNTKYFINWMRWKDSRTLLVATYFPDKRNDFLGFRTYRSKTREGRLLIVDTKTGEVRRPFKKVFLNKFKVLPSWLSGVVDILPDDPEHILMMMPNFRGGYYSVIYKVNIFNQRTRVVQRSQGNISGWETDRQHRVRIGYYRKDGLNKIMVRDVGSKKLRELWRFNDFSAESVFVHGFGFNPNELYISAYHEGFLALFKVDITDPELTRELVYQVPNVDVGGRLLYSHAKNKVVGISSSEEGGTLFFDKGLNNLQKGINKAMPSTQNYIGSLTDDLQSYLVYSVSSTESGTYFLGRRNPPRLDAISYRYGNLSPEKMSPVKDYPYEARDGLSINGLLTVPKGVEPKNLPTIIFPHGGPIARDTASFDYWVQFFASKGYAVLQMNFRGSTGQGIEFLQAGLKQWGKEMQNDIEDGTHKLVADGISDPKKICIAGASYGGYAALMGVAKTPDLYRCAISINGVSDVFKLVLDNRSFWSSYNVVDEMIGRDGDHLRSISPVNHVKKIKVPILLVHGEMDRQVKVDHSRKMHAALTKAGKDSTYIEQKNEDHYLANEDHRIEVFQAMSDFLDKHLPLSP
ncbi:MAG: S9 family peptidase [Alteromonadaceae bacterium]|nr:MAG: S9 family peptidase [Alteromonadaceae bacterium]